MTGDGVYIFTNCDTAGQKIIIYKRTGSNLAKFQTISTITDDATWITCSKDGKYFAYGSTATSLQVYKYTAVTPTEPVTES